MYPLSYQVIVSLIVTLIDPFKGTLGTANPQSLTSEPLKAQNTNLLSYFGAKGSVFFCFKGLLFGLGGFRVQRFGFWDLGLRFRAVEGLWGAVACRPVRRYVYVACRPLTLRRSCSIKHLHTTLERKLLFFRGGLD